MWAEFVQFFYKPVVGNILRYSFRGVFHVEDLVGRQVPNPFLGHSGCIVSQAVIIYLSLLRSFHRSRCSAS